MSVSYIHCQFSRVVPGSATLQRGFWSRAGARRSQGEGTGAGLTKWTSSGIVRGADSRYRLVLLSAPLLRCSWARAGVLDCCVTLCGVLPREVRTQVQAGGGVRRPTRPGPHGGEGERVAAGQAAEGGS